MLKKRLSDAWWLLAVVLFVLLLASPAGAQSIVIHLKNGDRVSGRIVSESTNTVRLTNQFLGSIEVPLAEISKREVMPAPALPAVTNAPAVVTTKSATNVVTASTNVAAAAPPPKPPLSPANPEATPIASTPSYWKHDLRFGVNLRYATKDSHEFLSILKSTYGKPPFRHIFDVNFKYGRVEGALAANSLAASEKTEYQLTPKSYVFSLIGGGYDEIRKIDYQFEVGPGFGVEILKLTNFVWKGEMGFNFQQQNRADDTRQNSYSLRVAEIFAWRIWEKLTADLKVEFFPNLDEFGEYRLRIESTLRYPVSNRLSLNLDVIDLYDTRPPAEVSKNDLQIRSTIGVTF
jgi:putative salt-induced outer membrane protein YdiY